jgi:ABC-type amino acid transport substrate-binding protein
VPFSGASDDVFGEMLAALRTGSVDAVVDDDVALVPLADAADLTVAFTVETRNHWGIAVAKHRPQLRAELDQALDGLVNDGSLRGIWERWMPTLPFPF